MSGVQGDPELGHKHMPAKLNRYSGSGLTYLTDYGLAPLTSEGHGMT